MNCNIPISFHLNSMLIMSGRASNFPTWQGLKHFNKIMDIAFSDAVKLGDIVKVLIPLIGGMVKEINTVKSAIDTSLCCPQCPNKGKKSTWIYFTQLYKPVPGG